MSRDYYAIAFTSAVRDAQVQYGSRAAQDRLHQVTGADDGPTIDPPHFGTPVRARMPHDPLGEAERAFIAEQDGFYLATVSQSGWPYVQFRGGPAGFVTTPDEHTLAWPDFRGNRQYVTTGNLDGESRVAMIFLDYARQARLKIFGVARSATSCTTPPRPARSRLRTTRRGSNARCASGSVHSTGTARNTSRRGTPPRSSSRPWHRSSGASRSSSRRTPSCGARRHRRPPGYRVQPQPAKGEARAMDDDNILDRISTLIAREHHLRAAARPVG